MVKIAWRRLLMLIDIKEGDFAAAAECVICEPVKPQVQILIQ